MGGSHGLSGGQGEGRGGDCPHNGDCLVGLLQQEYFLRKVKTRLEEIQAKTSLNNLGSYFVRPICPQSLLFTFGGWSGSGPVSTNSVFDPAATLWRDLTITLPYNWAYMATMGLTSCVGATWTETRESGQPGC